MQQIFNLPGKSEIMHRLNSLNYDQHLTQKFFPLIAKHEFEAINAMGVNTIITLAIEDYCEGQPISVKVIMIMLMPYFIDKLVDDENIKKEALEINRMISEGI